jgi:hypothetical protein
MKIRTFFGLVLLSGIMAFPSGCAAPHFFTVTIYESPDRVVKLQAVSDANHGKGFSHPLDISVEALSQVMRGLRIEIHNTAFSLPFAGTSSSSGGQRAFSETEIKFFAPLFAKGLAQATPEELVTFYETAKVSDLNEITTSGGLFVQGDELHFVLSNHGAKTRVWEDNELYEAPYRLRPMEPIYPQPGRLLFDPQHLMVEQTRGMLNLALKAEPWQVGVRWKELH